MDVIVCECGHRFDRTGPNVLCPICGREHRAISVTDVGKLALTENYVVEKLQDDRTVGVNMGGDSGRDISAESQPGGQVVSSIRARPLHNEKNVPEVARILREHLNLAGATWQAPEICAGVPGREEGIDFILPGHGSSLKCQVVKPAFKKVDLWRRIACGETVQTTQHFAEAAGELRSAIEKKCNRTPPRNRASTTLVIDLVETPALALGDVLCEFQRLHAAWATSLGFAAIWIVGPTSSLTSKLV